ncbi:hypothetical protein [Arcticibacter eurypsychrophilus]|uniref:hypothetical protein n=1 Tax=Arcticibacter eurypsychrophilus TaxID=1434752 RepID=UPI00084DFBEF|nr:hypothetical protein [Arcticibacter eurypsychrophilus]
MFSVRFTICLLIALLFPFVLKVFKHVEIYPSLILPAGQNTLSISKKQMSYQYKQIYVTDIHNRRIKINHADFFAPIPIQFSSFILKRNFGLKFTKSSSPVDEAKKTELKHWIDKRIIAQSGPYKELFIVTLKNTISSVDGKLMESKIINEEPIYLN